MHAPSAGRAAARPGATLGVEEEYHVVDAQTYALRADSALSDLALGGRLGPRTQAEISTTQLEVATGVCSTLGQLREELREARREASAAVSSVGAAILVASTHPFSSWQEQRLTPRPRYLELLERWGVLALQQDIVGCHVHVSVPDLDTAVAVMDHARPYLPTLLALTGSSPFHQGMDTGYDSYRTIWFSRWPITGATEPLGDGAGYERIVRGLRVAGVAHDSSNLYWDVRPSRRYPTLEYRIGDVCTSVDDAVLHAALVRALTTTLADRVAAGAPAPLVPPELLRAARWRAARYGLAGELFDPVRVERLPARAAVWRLLRDLEPALAERGEWDEVSALADRVLDRGTSASRQRETLQRTGDPLAVAAWVVAASA